MTKASHRFKSINEIYERFNTAAYKIHFENHEYHYQNIFFHGEVAKHIYRCEEEQHNLVIAVVENVVVNVEGIYKI